MASLGCQMGWNWCSGKKSLLCRSSLQGLGLLLPVHLLTLTGRLRTFARRFAQLVPIRLPSLQFFYSLPLSLSRPVALLLPSISSSPSLEDLDCFSRISDLFVFSLQFFFLISPITHCSVHVGNLRLTIWFFYCVQIFFHFLHQLFSYFSSSSFP